MKIDYKKTYYYIIALIVFFVLLWGVIDFASALGTYFSGSVLSRPKMMSGDEPNIEEYYQKRVTQDRLFDSLARIIVAGGIFIYAKIQIRKIEEA